MIVLTRIFGYLIWMIEGSTFCQRADLSYDATVKSSTSSANPTNHGTLSSGVMAMVPNNKVCGVGIAHGAQIGGITISKGEGATTDMTVATAFAFGMRVFDILSNSWSPNTEGRLVSSQHHMEREAVLRGVVLGRARKGAIFVLSAGNYKQDGDGCAFNAVSNDPHLILIASANQHGKATEYSNQCANVFATTYSSDAGAEGVVSTFGSDLCTHGFTKTSASVPIASGIIALSLQVNPQLTYRDVQHLITMSAEVAPLADNPGTWRCNNAGFWVSQDFGFGLLNAQNMAVLANGWRSVPELFASEKIYKPNPPPQVRRGAVTTVYIDAGEAGGILFLERVSITFSIAYPGPRGCLVVRLRSPQGEYPTE